MSFALVNAHVVPVVGEPFSGTVVVREGLIAAAGPQVEAPADVHTIDASGQWVLPGFIDAHAHVGLWEEGNGWAGQDVNEMSGPVTAGVRAIDAVNPADLGFTDALSGGVTTVNLLPGSANVIGGLAVAVSTYGTRVDDMVLRQPTGLKSALGENPKRVYGDRKVMPGTRLGIAWTLRENVVAAQDYLTARERDATKETNLLYEAIGLALRGEVPWRQHCHRADDIATALRLAKEFGYQLVLDHGTEAHLMADVVAEAGVPVLYGPMLTSRSKVEVVNRSLQAPGILEKAGVKVCLVTDHPVIPIELLITQAAFAVREGMTRDGALRAITMNPAEVLGLSSLVGSLEVGKRADVVLWSGDPFDLQSRALRVWVGGDEAYTHASA